MLKKRIIPILQYSDYNAIKTKQFSSIRNIGNLLQYVKVFNSRKSDELAIINLSKRFNNISYDFEYLRSVTSECNMPLIIGGSLSSLLEIETLLIEIKPEKQTMPPKKGKKKNRTILSEAITYEVNLKKWESASEFCKKHNIKFKLITEKDLF